MFIDHTYPDLDAGARGSTQPVAVGAEAQSVDDVSSVQGVKVLALIEIPQHGLTVLNRRPVITMTPTSGSPESPCLDFHHYKAE